MQISESWLREFVNPAASTEEIVEQLTMAGLEVGSIEPAAAEFSGVVVGQVVALDQHPNADKLKVCQVDVGDEQTLQIVCGASNVRPNLKIPVALVGAVLPGNFKIKKSKLRGELSLGMLCSEKELGLASDADGLMELSDQAPIGKKIRDYLSLDDKLIEFDLTPNRADCLSVEGIAREVAVLNKLTWQPVLFEKSDISHQDRINVSVEDEIACPKYLGRLIKNVNPNAETPLWMQEKLRRSGIRSLGAIVDVTNFVLLELGQPLHAFDAALLTGSISVRKSASNEELILLNDQQIKLDEKTLIIADEKQPLALAGVMGGRSSAVNDQTTDVFLECAFFDPIAIAGKARQYGLHTDSSHRFERGVDYTLQERAIERATQLIVEISGGSVGPISVLCKDENLPERNSILLRRKKIEKLLGLTLADDLIVEVIESLGMQIEPTEEGWAVIPPGCRFDIAIEEDLIEELGRIYGYNNIPNARPKMQSKLASAEESVLTLDTIQDLLVSRGYQEAITYSFVDEEIQRLLAPDEEFVSIDNPISSELSVMRTTLFCGLVKAALYNVNRQQSRVRLFETGLRFIKHNGETLQQKSIAGLILGNCLEAQWGADSIKVDFFDLKGDIEAILSRMNQEVQFSPVENSALHPGQSAQIISLEGDRIGIFGMLHPTLEKKLGFETEVFLFELDQEILLNRHVPSFISLSKFPSVRRDMALIVKEKISYAEVICCILGCKEKAIKDVEVFDVYRGKGIKEGYKSMALGMVLQDAERTLTEPEIDAIFSKVLETLSDKLNAKLRD